MANQRKIYEMQEDQLEFVAERKSSNETKLPPEILDLRSRTKVTKKHLTSDAKTTASLGGTEKTGRWYGTAG